MRQVSRSAALKRQTHHAFTPGVGYFEMGALAALPDDRRTIRGSNPPDGTRDGTRHHLTVPGGGAQVDFVWIAAERAWARHSTIGTAPAAAAGHNGNRMAWPADYLTRAGWEYSGPVD